MKTREVVKRIDKFFAPDITVLVDNNGVIMSRRALTPQGHKYIAYHSILGENYDAVLRDSELCIESIVT